MAKKLMTPRSKNTPVAWALKHRLVSLALICLILVVSIWGVYSYVQYQQKFSKDDFEKLTAMAEAVLHKTSGQPVETSRTCSYERPGEFDSLHLYCQIWAVTYLQYLNDEQAISVARSLESISKDTFGSSGFFPLSRFYQKPHDGSDTLTVTLNSPFPVSRQCNLYVQTNTYALDAVTFLPKKSDSNLIALSFECSAESRTEYFPVTYRQG